LKLLRERDAVSRENGGAKVAGGVAGEGGAKDREGRVA
jgi:hypothetical protein